eukprot:TRINITY_DN53999_c0_g1_i1.p1 TRINITY_DN53999_c0_g1~~TRINITY_DN53999_c0_g1_i1.p1  ORF type:complete len:405 (+),score=72.46 TRINITY_DN53999_c0_g1_i1:187-1401(+)
MSHSMSRAPRGKLTREEHREWARKLWTRMDRDGSDAITTDELVCDEFQVALRSILVPHLPTGMIASYGRSEQNIRAVINHVMRLADSNNDGELDFKEFERFWRVLRNERQSPDLIFSMFDLDQSGLLSRDEIVEVYRYFLGHRPILEAFESLWDELVPRDKDRSTYLVTRDRFSKWMKETKIPAFKQHCAKVAPGDDASSTSGLSVQKKAASTSKIWRPAPGLMPPRERRDTTFIPEWNDRFNSQDPSEQNLAFRGNKRMKTWFSSPHSLPELHRFYCTYQGFDSLRKELVKPPVMEDKWPPSSPPGARHRSKVREDPTIPREIPILSTDTLGNMAIPGATRHVPGGTMKDGRGQRILWQELTPRALKKQPREPGTLLLRSSGLPPAWLAVGRSKPCEAASVWM